MEMKFFLCEICGNLITKIRDSGVSVVCCGQKMTELVPNTTDAAREKHVPVVTREGEKVTVCIGSVAHPMTAEHYIECIALQSKNVNQIKELKPGDAPEAVFYISADDEIEAAYAYCNLHGLWKA